MTLLKYMILWKEVKITISIYYNTKNIWFILDFIENSVKLYTDKFIYY